MLFFLFVFFAVEAQIKLFPENLTVLRGEKARFTCTPSNSQWTAMVWLLNGEVALTISNEHGVLQSPNTNLNLMAEKKKDGWMLVLNNTERHDEGEVTCDLQGVDRKTARLFVQGLYISVCVYVCLWESQQKNYVGAFMDACMHLSLCVCVT